VGVAISNSQSTAGSASPWAEVALGDHICCFFSGSEDRDRILLSYLSTAVRNGDKCLCVVDEVDPDVLRRSVERRVAPAPNQLDLERAELAYLPDGSFCPDRMIGRVEGRVRAAVDTENFPAVRAAGVMTWALRGAPGTELLPAYEQAVDGFAARYPQVMMCLYDVKRSSVDMVLDAARSHPKLLLGGRVVESPLYGACRTPMSQMVGVSALSLVMFDRRDDREILDLALGMIPSIGRCRIVASCLAAEGERLRGPDGEPLSAPEIARQLVALDGADGQTVTRTAPWAWAYALRTVGGHAGYVVVGADEEPPAHDRLLLSLIAQQTGAALTSAEVHRRDGETAAGLRQSQVDLARANEHLKVSVTDLERRRRIREVLTTAVASGAGERGIAAAVHQLTDMPVAVEDRFGNERARVGPSVRPSSNRPASRSRDEVLEEARSSGGPLRDRDRVIALAQPRGDVLGVLAVIDPDHRVGEYELVVLEEGAAVLAMELVHARALAETELRLRRDLVEDLLSGTDDESALARASALGYDLASPHHVLLVSEDAARGHALEHAVERAVAAVLHTRPLIAGSGAELTAVVPRPDRDAHDRWHQLYGAVAQRLRPARCSIGVGGAATQPSGLGRSYEQARWALRVRQSPEARAGITAYDELGVYRLLACGEEAETGRFIREWLGVLLDYDRSNRSDLVETLRQYYEHGGSYDATARALMIHRSTLRYRLRRIRELSGYDLNAVDAKLNLHLATRAWHITRCR
jgi:sugar diacid utilization regulator